MIYFAISGAVFALDSWIKERVEKQGRWETLTSCARDGMAAGMKSSPCEGAPATEKKILKDSILLHRYHNQGAMLDFMEKRPKIVALLSGVLTGALALALGLQHKERGKAGYRLGLAFLLGGALSNTSDRIRRGYVVDYFSFQTPWKKLNDIVFNISDGFIFLGSILAAVFHK